MTDPSRDIATRLQSIIDTAIDGILTIDDQGNIESINPAAAQLFGYQRNEVVGQNIKILMPQPYHSEHDGYIHRYNKTRIPRIIGIGREVQGQKKNGEIFPLRLAISEVKLEQKTIFTGVIQDLTAIHLAKNKIEELNKQLAIKVSQRTYELEKVVNKLLSTNKALTDEVRERKEVEDKLRINELELKKALEKEKELNNLKTRFVSMASHEFRTPLASIQSSAAIISRYLTEEDQDKRIKHVKRITNAVGHLTTILNDFLSIDKLENEKFTLNISEINFESFFNKIIDETQALLNNGQNIEFNIHGKRPTLLTDDLALKSVISNLLSNAIKYSDQKINCDIFFEQDYYLIAVQDRGIGIPIQDQKYLFARFFRAENAANIQGTGLGLNIVMHYVKLLGGEINFESEENQGSTFSIKIPYFKSKD